ncbi:glycosyltransferase [Brachybacterium alimentarium]|uniref:glycosyltransferase n=1 Tax=Brachybacterium alimentarium TaxID=47845 RepID=UPI000DF340A7|nr:glycosyltransferase [Brachybacterium alimentarium]RCS83336.1 glycosyltransferase [Brachybacterium alimentarium]
MRTVFILIHALGYAGRSAAVLDQCRMFINMGLKPTIVTFKYEPRFDEDISTRKGDFALPAGASAMNIYRELRAPLTHDHGADWSREDDESSEGLTVSRSVTGKQTRLDYFDHTGRVVKMRMLSSSKPTKTLFYRNGLVVMQRDYEDTGACGRERSFDIVSGKTTEERYFTPDGLCYVTRHLDPSSGRQLGVYSHNPSAGTSRRFAHNTPWHADWLESLLRSERDQPFVIAQHPTAMLKLLETDPSLSSRLYLSHVNLFQAPFTVGSELRADYAQPFRRVKEMPVVLSLTEAQAADMRTTFGADNCDPFVVPNVIRDRRTRDSIKKVPGRVGIVCRLHPEQKRVDDLLHAWVDVVAAVPNARLEIGGDGEARKELEKLTTRLGVGDSVSFLGWLDDSVDFMASCTLTVSTGRSEGFGLSIGESLAAGTPVVSYDINYGPSDLIRDEVDGLLVEDGNKTQLACAIIRLLKQDRRTAKMGRRSAERMQALFSMAAIEPKWKAALEMADARS